MSARRDGPSKRWNLATFCSTNLFGARAGVADAGEVASPEAVFDGDDVASVPKEMMRMSKDAYANKKKMRRYRRCAELGPHTLQQIARETR